MTSVSTRRGPARSHCGRTGRTTWSWSGSWTRGHSRPMTWTQPSALPGSCEASGCQRRLERPVCRLADDELPHSHVVVAQFHERPVDPTTHVVGAGVDACGASDGCDAAGFVNMTVEREERLELLDDLAGRLAPDRDLVGLAIAHYDGEVLGVHLPGGVESRVIGRGVEHEDGPGRVGDLLSQPAEMVVESLFVHLSWAIPWRRVDQ